MSYYYPQACIKLRILPEDFQLTSDASKQKPFELTVIPKDVSVNVGDHKTGDTFNCELDFKNFPFDPRSIRACGIVVHMQDMKALYNSDGSLKTITPTDDNAVFQGFVDEDMISLNDNKQTVRFEGRDFTALLIDQKYKESAPLSLNQPIDVVITTLLATFKATKEIKVINSTGQTTLPTLAQYYPDFGSPQAGMRNSGAHESYWDIIQDLVSRAGLIAYIHLDKLVITTPRNLYDDSKDLKMIYGRNLKSLTMKRKLGRFKGFNIRIRSRVGKKVLKADIPEEATPAWCKAFGIERKPVQVPVLKPDGSIDAAQTHLAPYMAFPVPNIGNKDQLIRIGQTTFEDYSRQQLEGELETLEMLGHAGADDTDPNWHVYDLTQLDIGQTICIEIATDDLREIARTADLGQRTQYLIRKNYPPEVAAIFASTMGKFSPRFFTKSFTMSLNQDTGFKLKVDFINIIELTHAVFK